MYGSMSARLRVSPPCAARPTGRSNSIIIAQSRGEASKEVVSRRAAGLLSGAALLSIGLGRAHAEDLGETITKLEIVEPEVAEELKKIQAVGGIEEVKDIVADIVDVETQLETLEKKVEGLGGEADPLGLAQATEPLKQRLKELGDLIALFVK